MQGRFRSSVFLALFLLAVRASGAQTADIIRGRVTSDSGKVLAAADIIVTMAPSAETFVSKTDSAGVYRVEIPKGSGEYLLYIGMTGFRPFRQRVTRKGSETEFVVDAKLAPAVQQLAAVRVQATHPRPVRPSADAAPGTDPTDKTMDGVTGALSPELQGNLDAMAALIPGLTITPNGTSAFGLGSESNMTQMNGMSFPGAEIPRDARMNTRFVTSPWDPSRGGAAGAFTVTAPIRGTNVSGRRGHVTLDAPAFQFGDALAAKTGQTFTNVLLSTGGDGALRLDEYFYNIGVQGSRRTSDAVTLIDLDPLSLANAGLSRDSAQRVLQVLGAQGIPLARRGIPGGRVTTGGSLIARIDHAVPTVPPTAVPRPTWWLNAFGQYSKTDALSLSSTSTPGSTGERSNGVAVLQGSYARFLGKDGDYVNELTSALNITRSHGAPYLDLPSGNVLVASDAGASGRTFSSVGFGGNSGLSSDNTTWSWEVVNETGFLLRNKPTMPFKLYFQSRLDGFDQETPANRLGAFSFASLNDLANGVPSSYSRTLNAPRRRGGEWIGASALGGSWRTGPVDWTGGARIDANVFTSAPAFNPRVEQLFGLRNDHAPNTIGVSPRLGFKWYYKTHQPGGINMNVTQASMIIRGGPVIRGGIGEFRDNPQSTLLADAMSTTGLPGGVQRLLCIGQAAPVPNWSQYEADPSSIPRTCANNTTSFADTARAVTLFDRHYAPLRSWRGTLGWTNTIKDTYITIDGTYGLTLNQPGTVDLNFAGTPQFALESEGGRPVFVPASSIVSSTGAVSNVASRRFGEFARVGNRVSDLRGDVKQITVYAIPNLPFRVGLLTLGYTYADARSQARGFDQTTSGDPRLREWAPSSFQPRHQFIVQAAHFRSKFAVTSVIRASSGLRFTPLVAGDVNGDGLSFNDRAYVFGQGSDASVANDLQTLMTAGPGAARDCLSRQIGAIVARNSCVGPWSATMNATLFVFPTIPRTRDRAKISLSFANPLGGIDRLLHGTNLHGWGMQPFPDQTLYQVRGYDASKSRFTYQVNSRFGSTSPSTSGIRAPFRITLDVSLDIGHSAQEQQLALTMRMRPAAVGTRAPADSLRARFMRQTSSNGFMDFYGLMLSGRYADSLALSREQMEQFQSERATLRAKADSIFRGLAEYLAALPNRYDQREAVKRQAQASTDVWNQVYAEKDFLLKVLTPGQVRRLPQPLYQMVTVPNYKGRFFFQF
jgi:hypothetical protein